MRVEGDLPEMSVWVGEIAVVAAPKRPGRLLQDLRAGSFGLANTVSTSVSLATFCATQIPPLPFQIAPARPSSSCASRLHNASTTPPALKKLTLASLARFDFTKPRRS